ncbi:hypothetical protein BDZ89DRAFT_1045135 [Hymenopellis radicata]|nr:hypothetical protein BDZ89DRAFT_1045135 [Hymenopellis radicata]
MLLFLLFSALTLTSGVTGFIFKSAEGEEFVRKVLKPLLPTIIRLRDACHHKNTITQSGHRPIKVPEESSTRRLPVVLPRSRVPATRPRPPSNVTFEWALKLPSPAYTA